MLLKVRLKCMQYIIKVSYYLSLPYGHLNFGYNAKFNSIRETFFRRFYALVINCVIMCGLLFSLFFEFYGLHTKQLFREVSLATHIKVYQILAGSIAFYACCFNSIYKRKQLKKTFLNYIEINFNLMQTNTDVTQILQSHSSIELLFWYKFIISMLNIINAAMLLYETGISAVWFINLATFFFQRLILLISNNFYYGLLLVCSELIILNNRIKFLIKNQIPPLAAEHKHHINRICKSYQQILEFTANLQQSYQWPMLFILLFKFITNITNLFYMAIILRNSNFQFIHLFLIQLNLIGLLNFWSFFSVHQLLIDCVNSIKTQFGYLVLKENFDDTMNKQVGSLYNMSCLIKSVFLGGRISAVFLCK